MANELSDRRVRTVAWVLGSTLIWAAVIVDTGAITWPLTVWALTTFAPLVRPRRW